MILTKPPTTAMRGTFSRFHETGAGPSIVVTPAVLPRRFMISCVLHYLPNGNHRMPKRPD